MKAILLLVCACFLFGCIEQSDLTCMSICKKKFPGYKIKTSVAKHFYLMDEDATRCLCPLILPLGTQLSKTRDQIDK